MTNYLCLIGTLFIGLCLFTEAAIATPDQVRGHGPAPSYAAISISNAHFVSFKVVEINQKVLVSWEAVETQNVSHYLVERRSLSGTYLAIGGINVGRSQHALHMDFIDQMNRKRDRAFIYRVKQVLKDGTFHYSPEQILYHYSNQNIRVYPQGNPDVLELEFLQEEVGPYTVELLNLEGRSVALHQVQAYQTPLGRFPLPIADLARGMYIVRISVDLNAWTQRILVP